jgi:hypothetical protein
MRDCQQCGTTIGETATFCPVCGAATSSEAAPCAPRRLRPARSVPCALCGLPGPLVEVESFRLCERCQCDLEVLVARESGAGVTDPPQTSEGATRHSAAEAVDAADPPPLDSVAGGTCVAMAGQTTTDLGAESFAPNPNRTVPDADRGASLFEEVSVDAGEVRAFLECAVEHILPLTAQSVAEFRELRSQDPVRSRLHVAFVDAHQANTWEEVDAPFAAVLYRQAAVRFLESSEDPLDSQEVRRELLVIFDRLSNVLEKSGLQAEALEEIDCAASLGLLDYGDGRVEGHREALIRRRDGLQGDGQRRAIA